MATLVATWACQVVMTFKLRGPGWQSSWPEHLRSLTYACGGAPADQAVSLRVSVALRHCKLAMHSIPTGHGCTGCRAGPAASGRAVSLHNLLDQGVFDQAVALETQYQQQLQLQQPQRQLSVKQQVRLPCMPLAGYQH